MPEFFESEIRHGGIRGLAQINLSGPDQGGSFFTSTPFWVGLGVVITGVTVIILATKESRIVKKLKAAQHDVDDAAALAIEAMADVQAAGEAETGLISPDGSLSPAVSQSAKRTFQAGRKSFNKALSGFKLKGCAILPGPHPEDVLKLPKRIEEVA